jgi:hypothetical protein
VSETETETENEREREREGERKITSGQEELETIIERGKAYQR